MKQFDLFPVEDFPEFAPAPVYRPDPDKVRARLRKILSEAKAADAMPWDHGRLSLNRLIFPQMTGSLPDDEAAQWRAEWDAEMARLDPLVGG